MTTLVLGQSGQLATHLRSVLPDAVFWGRETLDLGEPAKVAAMVIAAAPGCIVNAAAYTAVDRAESEPDAAWRINVEGVAELARAAAALDVPLIHVSSDYVFDGRASGPNRVGDPVNPQSAYGRSKLGGEIAAETLCEKHWILRTSWVFSEHGANFVKTMIRLGGERDALNVVADQHGVPTYAGDLAAVIAGLVAHADETPAPLAFGIHHAVGGPPTTWHGFATRIFALAAEHGLIAGRPAITAIPTSAYPTPARRPANSVLEPSPALFTAAGATMDWKAGLATVIARLSTNPDPTL